MSESIKQINLNFGTYLGFTAEQAKRILIENLENELVHEKAAKIMDIEQQTKDEAENLAREIITVLPSSQQLTAQNNHFRCAIAKR